MEIRSLHPNEQDEWLRLREQLWPDASPDVLAAERAELVADPERYGVLVAAETCGLVGFVEVSIRDWAEGCKTRPVGYLEAWYVAPDYRRAGVGRKLVEAAEGWAAVRGCTEMGSDADQINAVSHAAHQAVGFAEVGRLVMFSKQLAPAQQVVAVDGQEQ